MIKEGKFGVQETVCLVTITISNKVFFSSPGFLTRFVGTTGWLMTLISDAAAVLAFTFIYLLLKRFPGKNIVEIFDNSMGRVIGFIFSFTFAASFLVSAGIVLREYIDVSKVYVYPATPISLLMGAFVIIVATAAFLGLESIARVSKLFAYASLSGYILLLLLSSQNFKLSNLFPILGYGLDKTVINGLERSSAYSEVVVLAVFAGSLQGTKNIKKAGYISLILSGFIISSGLLCTSLAFPYFTIQEISAPLYMLSGIIKYGSFLQRLDPIFLFLWNTTTFITVSVLFYSSVSIYCKTFRLQDTRPVIIPLSVLLFTVAMIPKDFTSVVTTYVQGSRTSGIFVFYALPIIALITAILRKKKGEKSF